MPLVQISDLVGAPDELNLRCEQASELLDRYKDYVATPRTRDAYRTKPAVHASSISKCERQIVYSLLGTERQERIAHHWMMRFKVGHSLHDMLQRDFHHMANNSGGEILFQDEVKISPEEQPVAKRWNIRSSCDGVFTFREKDNEEWKDVLRVGLEVKTESPDGFDSLKAPRPDHVEQGHVYMACLDLPLMWFLYVNKGNQNMTPSEGAFLVPFNPDVWTKIESRLERVHSFAARKELPDRQESIGCEFCPYSYTCEPARLARKSRALIPPGWTGR